MDEDNLPTVPRVLTELARAVGTKVIKRRLEIPEKFGTGYCAGFVFNEHIRLLILNYELKEDLVIANPDGSDSGKMILFKFQHVIPRTDIVSKEEIPSVLIVTSGVNPDLVIPVHSNRAMINIEVDASYLKSLLDPTGKSPVLQSLLTNTQPLLFEEMISPSLQTIIDELTNESVDEPFDLFFRRIKAEELICRLLMELEKRDEKQLYALNSHDIQTIYWIKKQLLERLEVPPVISELAVCAHMSPTKLKRLFKQMFGNSLFRYYQSFRMQEAARLLKEKQLSVSEVGYQLGFTNLSHFSRVFEEYIGMKPKKYSGLQMG